MAHKAWGTILTADSYVVGCLILHYSLQRVHTTYPLIVLATSTLSSKAREKVKARGIEIVDIDHFEPTRAHTYGVERFRDTWNKLAVFQLEQFERLILLDCDMLVRSNMDELMNIPLEENQIAASYACACNPRRFPHYPKTWWVPPSPSPSPTASPEVDLNKPPQDPC
ncbi:glycosyltransferase family 8 protein [Atractiella rhizophila]|nr:glycosyltransferase family 8 protein [Atractiella rhizophila]